MGRPRMATQRLCSEEGCKERHYAKNFCKRHYHQMRRAAQKKKNDDIPVTPDLERLVQLHR
ncbi:hypothetical protein NDS46_11490 [Paenibacillus thiaminolyticus]|uniref:hypothetical protein n=1 Tax=Paenibacillus thiaminolyticus TaxID=49283 RepID=UPI0023311CC9|nr:hypothetical protein [Paenibacillus thiaminolyticus]WCF10422.1 hypothetical protein NDS46_11490 [Paenibacillus thiaminolyticus]